MKDSMRVLKMSRHGAIFVEGDEGCIGPKVKQVLHTFWGVVINTIAYHLGRYSQSVNINCKVPLYDRAHKL